MKTSFSVPLWMPMFMLTAAFALIVVCVAFLNVTEQSSETAVDRAFRSALLPDGWKTWSADVWSVGYPADWVVEAFDGGVSIHPLEENAEELSFVVIPVDQPFTEYEPSVAFGDEVVEKSTFLFAGYPAVKYTLGNGEALHVIGYDDRVYLIVTHHIDLPEVGIMLATFQFPVKR